MPPVKPQKKVLFARIPPELLAEVSNDCHAFEITKDGMVQAALINHFLFKRAERARLYQRIPRKIFGKAVKLALIFCALSCSAYTPDQIADAIRIEEGNNPHWLYGIHHKGTTPLTEAEARRRCLLTISHYPTLPDLAAHYCPANSNSWLRNVQSILKHHH